MPPEDMRVSYLLSGKKRWRQSPRKHGNGAVGFLRTMYLYE